jgi:hypothetical protein
MFRRFCTIAVLVALAAAFGQIDLSAQSARCRDGSLSYSATRSGTCSRHGGVAEWLSAASPTPKSVQSAPNPPVVTAAPRLPRTPAVVAAARDSRGRIKRSAAAKATFMRQTGYPRGRPGYVVDHVVPLACGGPDSPSNMQWQAAAEAKAKDKTERIGCGSR